MKHPSSSERAHKPGHIAARLADTPHGVAAEAGSLGVQLLRHRETAEVGSLGVEVLHSTAAEVGSLLVEVLHSTAAEVGSPVVQIAAAVEKHRPGQQLPAALQELAAAGAAGAAGAAAAWA